MILEMMFGEVVTFYRLGLVFEEEEDCPSGYEVISRAVFVQCAVYDAGTFLSHIFH